MDSQCHILPIIRSLANDQTDEEFRVEASILLANISSIIGADNIKKHIVPLIIELSNDASFRVRKSVAQYFGKICKVVGQDCISEHLVSF